MLVLSMIFNLGTLRKLLVWFGLVWVGLGCCERSLCSTKPGLSIERSFLPGLGSLLRVKLLYDHFVPPGW